MASIKKNSPITRKKIIIIFFSLLIFKVLNNFFIYNLYALNSDRQIQPRVLIPGDSNPNFTIQHYFYTNLVNTSDSNPTGVEKLDFINTSSGTPGIVPTKKNTKDSVLDGITDMANPTLVDTFLAYNPDLSDERREFKTTSKLIELFEDEPTDYMTNPQMPYINRLYNSMTEYNFGLILIEVWIYQPNADGTFKNTSDLEENDFIKYPVPLSQDGIKHEPEKIRFTNNPNNSHISDVVDNNPIADTASDTYPYDYTILIQENTVIRLVFDSTESSIINDANFFDYDISDGYIYTANNRDIANRRDTSTQDNTNVWYAYTYNSGINNDDNYTGTGVKYAFGNSNTLSGKADEIWNGININKVNRLSYKGVSYNLLKGFSYNSKNNPIPEWSDGIIAPNIFDETENVIGKTDYTKSKDNGFKLEFYRKGSSFTLDKVIDNSNQATLKDLRGLQVVWTDGTRTIYSNEFWPFDKSESYGTSGHDFKFGDNSLSGNRMLFDINNRKNPAPISDKSADHNSYFGMNYSIDFNVHPGYTAPLDYWFYGDDDMWVFLSKVDDSGNIIENSTKMIMDIGGVHAPVGMYSNLWEYIDYNPLFNVDGSENKNAVKYRLTVFYTERGASGSSCYMHFNIPLDTYLSDPPERDEAIMVEKSYIDYYENEVPYDANGTKFHFLITLTNESGVSYEDIYDYAIYKKSETPDHLAATASPIEKGVIGLDNEYSGKYDFYLHGGEYIIISNLPDGTHFTIEEIGREQYKNYYQIGTHIHENDKQIDTLNSEKINFDENNLNRFDAKVINYVKLTNITLDYKDFSFEKVDFKDLTPIANVGFSLYEYTCTDMTDTSIVDVKNLSSCWKLHSTKKSDANGLVAFQKIYRDKRYRLVETDPPEGYIELSGQWNIDVSHDLKFTITSVGDNLPLAFMEVNEKLLLPNVKKFQLPVTGSFSGIMYTIFGTISVGLGIIILIFLNSKRKVN